MLIKGNRCIFAIFVCYEIATHKGYYLRRLHIFLDHNDSCPNTTIVERSNLFDAKGKLGQSMMIVAGL
jgi:hypothetical protein